MNSPVSLTINDIGLFSIIVDAGRTEGIEQGISESGPMDFYAYKTANWLCKNPLRTPMIESMGGITFTVSQPTTIAITGPEAVIDIDGETVSCWQSLQVKAGSNVNVVPAKIGQKHYIGVTGTWDVPRVAGSACAVKREGLGGLRSDGSALERGDSISVTRIDDTLSLRRMPVEFIPDYELSRPLIVIPGYQFAQFDNVALHTFSTEVYTLTNNMDRMGFRLNGPAIPCELSSLRSEGINMGSVQVPPDGQPIIMMRDRQTIGGYPKLGNIAPQDLDRLAQCVPGDRVSFIFKDTNNTRSEWLLKEQRFQAFIQGYQ